MGMVRVYFPLSLGDFLLHSLGDLKQRSQKTAAFHRLAVVEGGCKQLLGKKHCVLSTG